MIRIATSQLWVHDQDEALAFYTDKLGMEVRADVTVAEMGDFRWLTVGPPGQPEIAIVLMAISGPPVADEATAAQIRDLMGKGMAGTVFLTTPDCQGPTRSCRPGAWSSPSRRSSSSSTASTAGSATRRATTCASPSSTRASLADQFWTLIGAPHERASSTKRTTRLELATFGLGSTFWRFCGVVGCDLKSALAQGFLGVLSGVLVRSNRRFCAPRVGWTWDGIVARPGPSLLHFAPWCICVPLDRSSFGGARC